MAGLWPNEKSAITGGENPQPSSLEVSVSSLSLGSKVKKSGQRALVVRHAGKTKYKKAQNKCQLKTHNCQNKLMFILMKGQVMDHVTFVYKKRAALYIHFLAGKMPLRSCWNGSFCAIISTYYKHLPAEPILLDVPPFFISNLYKIQTMQSPHNK